MKKVYFACPECQELKDSMMVSVRQVVTMRAIFDKDGDVDYGSASEVLDEELEYTTCECGFYAETFSPEDFVVVIENDAIVEHGYYYDLYPETLQEIAKKHHLTIGKEVKR